VVERGSTLTLKNIKLQGVAGTNIRCLDDSAKIIMSDVDWVQSDDYVHQKGAMNINGWFELKGEGYQFAYQSGVTSIIYHNSCMYLDPLFTFSYDPVSGRNDHLFFEDTTSSLYLDGATLHITSVGLQLKLGKMSVHGNASIYAERDAASTGGIIFGHNNSDEDFVLEVLPGSCLFFEHGYCIYSDIYPSSLNLCDVLSTIKFGPSSILELEQSLPVGNGRIQLSSHMSLLRGNGASINGNVDFYE